MLTIFGSRHILFLRKPTGRFQNEKAAVEKIQAGVRCADESAVAFFDKRSAKKAAAAKQVGKIKMILGNAGLRWSC